MDENIEDTNVPTNEESTQVSSPEVEITQNASRPTENPDGYQVVGPPLVQFYGRKTLYADFDEKDVNSGSLTDIIKNITKILNDVWSTHKQNMYEIDYLEKYYRGFQPIIGKRKDVRPSINNIVIENNAYFAVNFKTGYVFGQPIQFVQRGDIANKEVEILNSYVLAEDKYAKDSELAESIYTSGIAHRLVLPNIDEDSPFDIENLDSKTTFCVYSSGVGHKKLLGCTFTKKVNTNEISGSIYTKTGFYTFTTGAVETSFKVQYVKPYYLKNIPIIEYSFNKWRMGIIEVVMSMFNAINRITSGDLDGLEQYIQSIMVFINQEIDKETYKDVLNLGAVELNTADPSRPADLKLLQNELSHSNTEVLHSRLINMALTIIGIPNLQENSSGGDTGEARKLGNGWTMADERANQEEMAFKRCSKEEIKLILSICKIDPNSNINDLTLKDIEMKFTRNKSDNFLVKAQGMMNLVQSGVSPDVAFAASGMFSDSNEVYTKSLDFYGGIENWIATIVSNTVSKKSEKAAKADIIEEDEDASNDEADKNIIGADKVNDSKE